MASRPGSPAELRDRWGTGDSEEVNRALEKGDAARLQSPFGVVDARIDLRGLTVSVIIKHRRLSALDFSHSVWKLAGQFIFSELEDCRFDHAEVPANLDRKFVRCSFQKAKMSRRLFRGVLEECDFTGANLRDAAGSEVTFKRCSFRGANLLKAHFLRCHFEDCDFSGASFGLGSLAGSKLERCQLDRDALGDTLLERVEWR